MVPASASVWPVRGIDQVGGELLAAQAVAAEPGPPALAGDAEEDLVVEGVEDRLLVETQGQQQRRHRQLAAPVDADVHRSLASNSKSSQLPR